MKRKLALVIVMLLIVLCFGLVACGNADKENADESSDEEAAAQEAEESEAAEGSEPAEESEPTEGEETADASEGGKSLVVYFSRTGEQYVVGEIDKGNTAIVGEMIAEEIGADTYEVLPEEDYYPYTYNELTDIAKQEQNENSRPDYQQTVPDLSQYDTIFIGAPVWWGDWPMIMYTFFEKEDLAGKKLYPFSTHEGSGLSGFDSKLQSACPDAEVGEGLAIRGSDAQNDPDSVQDKVNEWLSGLGY